MSESYFSLNSQIENKTPLNNLTSHISTSYIKWETRNGKWETRSGKWEIRNLEVGYGKGLNWALRNGKWEPNQNSRLWRFALWGVIHKKKTSWKTSRKISWKTSWNGILILRHVQLSQFTFQNTSFFVLVNRDWNPSTRNALFF